MSNLLLHACCGPCSTYSVKRLREEELSLTAFWYNPNIHPYMEHQQRLQSMKVFANKVELPLVVTEGYDMIEYFRRTVGREGDRCGECYQMRLTKTAQYARQEGFDAFSTTLLISPYQKHELLREVGETIGKEQGVPFHYIDLRPGFPESRRMAREMELYRQKYCGCVYSEWERYAKVNIGEDFRWA